MARKGYTTVAIPDELAKEVDKLIQKKTLGFRSRGEFVIEATRLKLTQILGEVKK